MSKDRKPIESEKTPDSLPEDVSDDVASDIIRNRKKTKVGRTKSFLTGGSRSKRNTNTKPSILKKRNPKT